jgi:hypothetical protein
MKADSPLFTLTPDLLKEWEREADTLEQEIEERQHKLVAVKERLHAAAVLTGQQTRPGLVIRIQNSPKQDSAEPIPAEGGSMIDAIAQIAAGSPAPITKKKLKRSLLDRGFPADRMNNYFYTCIMRLKQQNRIQALSDGRIWRPET